MTSRGFTISRRALNDDGRRHDYLGTGRNRDLSDVRFCHPPLPPRLARTTIGDEVGFNSDSSDIAAGATAIAAGFVVGSPPQMLGEIIDTSGNTVAQSVATCLSR